jgi:uncharacterized protein (DUF1778 family)
MLARIDVRPDQEAKARLDRAAARLGIPLASFVLSAALERAQQVLAGEARVLSDRDRDRVLALLDGSAPAPNSGLKKAMKRHREIIRAKKK